MSRSVITICPYCGVGCGIEVTIDDAGKIIGFEGFKGHPVSHGHLCGKGASSIKLLDITDRLLYPMKRVNGEFVRISWNEAISEIVHKMKEIREKYGPEALAFYGGCRNTLEEVYLFQKLARALGTNNVDSCARLCMIHRLRRSRTCSATVVVQTQLMKYPSKSRCDNRRVNNG